MMLYLLFFLIFICVVTVVISSLWYGISPMPSSIKVKKNLDELLPQIDSGNVLELGSGWGTLAFYLAERYPNCRVDAYEISPIPCFYSYCFQREEITTVTTQIKLEKKEDKASLHLV